MIHAIIVTQAFKSTGMSCNMFLWKSCDYEIHSVSLP